MSTTRPPRQTPEEATAVHAEWNVESSRSGPRTDAPPMVRNATASRLVIHEPAGSKDASGPPDRLVLAPFETLALSPAIWESWRHPLERLSHRRMIEILRPAKQTVGDRLPSIATPALVCATIGLMIAGVVLRSPIAWLAVGVAFGLVVLAWGASRVRDRFHLGFLAALGTSLLISAAMPALALYYAAGVGDLIEALRAGSPGPDPLMLVGRVAQWGFIWIAAFLPAGLYFLFDRVKLAALREGFERDILRFDPSLETVQDVRARYGAAMSEAFSSDLALGRDDRAYETDPQAGTDPALRPGRRRPGHQHGRALYRQIPVMLATVVIALGWTLALLNPSGPILERGGGDEFMLGLLQPHASPIVFAFLGAYTFTLLSLFRSYARRDLRPKSYTHAAVRIVVAMIFAWVLALIFLEPTDLTLAGNGWLLTASFLVGFVPETLLVRLQEIARAVARGRSRVSWLYERHPLTRLVGIDIYDRARLLEEGVGNIEGLAHHNLPELMLQTRIPVGRIVHWADQAILYIHVVSPDEVSGSRRHQGAQPGEVAERGEGSERADEAERRLRLLRGYGISTATALIRARGELGDTRARAQFLRLLDDPGDDEQGRPRRLEVVLAAIRDEQWIPHLTAWRDWHHANPDQIDVAWDGTPRRRRRAPVIRAS